MESALLGSSKRVLPAQSDGETRITESIASSRGRSLRCSRIALPSHCGGHCLLYLSSSHFALVGLYIPLVDRRRCGWRRRGLPFAGFADGRGEKCLGSWVGIIKRCGGKFPSNFALSPVPTSNGQPITARKTFDPSPPHTCASIALFQNSR